MVKDMAQRHLYSRVPAKASMYHMTDGYDTFAKSSELNREFIETGLGRLLEYVPGKTENDMVLDGILPPTYCMLRTTEGEIVHSCITYQRSDYTGERAAFMINSLVPDKQERERLFSQHEAAYFNPDMFGEKIEDFNICSPAFSPITDYPAAEYTTKPMKDISVYAAEFDERLIKRLLFALLSVTVYKNKSVFIAPVMPAEELSAWGLEFVNALMQIFPAFIRERLSFITFITDYKKMNCFNIKFVHAENIQTGGKGYVFDMTASRPDNIRDSEYKERENEINFLYELCENKTQRDGFTDFCGNIVKNDGEYDKPNLNVFGDLVLLFRQSRYEGEQEDNELIANDAASYKLISTYESHRSVLELKDRLNILGPLIARYSRTRIAIPANIFGKLSKLYLKEPPECRVTIMDGLLELIHTDAMRDKLFAFIKSNFDTETAERREVICENLSRVFYGGFLQEQIISLLDTAFGGETETSKNNILAKLLLSIRTEMIRDRVFELLKKHRDEMAEEHRTMIYTAMIEAIPAKDITSSKAVELIDHYSETETLVAQSEIIYELFTVLEEDEKTNGHGIADILITESDMKVKGRVSLGIIKRIVQKQTKKRIFGYMLNRLAGGRITGVFNAVEAVWKFDDTEPEAINKALSEKLKPLFESCSGNASLDDIIHLHKSLTESGYAACEYRSAVYRRICETYLYPLMGEKYIRSLDSKQYARPIAYYAEYAAGVNDILGYPGVVTVIKFAKLVKFLNADMPNEALETLFGLEIPDEFTQPALVRLKAECRKVFNISDNEDLNAVVGICVSGIYGVSVAAAEYFENRPVNLKKLFEANLRVLDKKLLDNINKAEKPPKNYKKAAAEAHDTAAVKALEGLVKFCACVCRTTCGDMIKQRLCYASVSELDYTLVSIYNEHFKGLKKEVMTLSQATRANDAIIAEKLKNDYGKKSLPERPQPGADNRENTAVKAVDDNKSASAASNPQKAEKKKGFGFFRKK